MSAPSNESRTAAPQASSAARRPRRLGRVLRAPRRTVRLRLTLLYGLMFLVFGGAMLAVTYVLVGQTTRGPNYSAGVTAKGAVVKGPSGNSVNLQIVVAGGRALAPAGASRALPQEKGAVTNNPVRVLEHGGGPGKAAPGPELPGGGIVTVDQARAQARKLEVGALDQARVQARKLEALGRQQHKEEMHTLLIDLAIALAIVAVMSLGLGWFLAGRMLRPLQTITKAARAISAKSLHRRLALRGPRDELREVGDTFDELLERLEHSFDAQRQFVANASHELRTPLTLERAILEVALADPQASNETLRATCERVLAIGEQQERMIDALLALARSERGLERRDPFDLSRVVGEVIAPRAPEIAARGLQLETALEEARTSGDASLTERLVANLIDNAARYNVAGGWIRVTSATADGRAIFTVANSGPVVEDEDLERLFRPFERIGAARASHGVGHGLGLSIVSAVATAHGADLQAHARPEGGLTISVSFGAADPEGDPPDVLAEPAGAGLPAAAVTGASSPAL